MKKNIWKTAPYLWLFSAFMIISAFVSLFFNKKLFFIELIIAVVSVIFSVIIYTKFNKMVTTAVKSSVEKSIDKRYLSRFGFPVVAIDKDCLILWYNRPFFKNICDETDVYGYSVESLISEYSIDELCSEKGGNITIKDAKYTVYANSVDTGYILYFHDDTYLKDIEKEYIDTRLSVAMVVIDNSDAYDDEDEDDEVQIQIQVESLVQRYAAEHNALFRKMGQGRYMLIIEERELQKMIDAKFDLLTKVHEIHVGDMTATISIGIGRGEKSLRKSQAAAKKALDMSLGRGGDQVSLLTEGDYEFFGGKSSGVERQSKVRARVITKSIISAIEAADRVLIMGHKFSDLDCVGSAIGLCGAITATFKKNTNIVVNYNDSMAKVLIDAYKTSCPGGVFIEPQDAVSMITPNTLLFVVDTQSVGRVESRDVYDAAQNIIVIDHHRMSVDHIENTLVFYHEPSASSASEMCVEIIDNFPEDNLKKAEAEALLSGIILDTKNFVINSGSRTFDAAAYLKKHGADTVSVRALFSDSIDIYRNKYKLVSTARIYKKCAIVIADENMSDIRLVASKAADELLGLQGVNASYVVYQTPDGVTNVSARSYGKRNVQIIMEKLGGGGHHSMAAAQLKDVSFEAAVRMLIEAIDNE